jgi:hypothetical protein
MAASASSSSSSSRLQQELAVDISSLPDSKEVEPTDEELEK